MDTSASRATDCSVKKVNLMQTASHFGPGKLICMFTLPFSPLPSYALEILKHLHMHVLTSRHTPNTHTHLHHTHAKTHSSLFWWLRNRDFSVTVLCHLLPPALAFLAVIFNYFRPNIGHCPAKLVYCHLRKKPVGLPGPFKIHLINLVFTRQLRRASHDFFV